MPQLPKRLYQTARAYYGDRKRFSRRGLVSKRTRLIIRLIAIEEVATEWGLGVLPQRTMAALRLLADYREAHKRSIFNIRGVARQVGIDIPLDDLVMTCGHPRPMAPVVAALKEGDRLFDLGESLRGFFCSSWCAKQGGRYVYAVLHYDPNPDIKDEERQLLS